MKISNDLPPPEFDPKNKQVADDAADKTRALESANGQSGSPVTLSNRAKELVQLTKLAEQVPEAQSGRVEALRLAVSESRYPLSPELLADSLLKNLSHHPEGI